MKKSFYWEQKDLLDELKNNLKAFEQIYGWNKNVNLLLRKINEYEKCMPTERNSNEMVVNRILALTRRKGIAIGELEKQSGLSTGYLSRCKKFEKGISISRLDNFCKILDCDLKDLII